MMFFYHYHLFLQLSVSLCQFMQYIYSVSHQVYNVVYHHPLFFELSLSLSQFMLYFYSISHYVNDVVYLHNLFVVLGNFKVFLIRCMML